MNDKNLDGMTPLHVAAKMGILVEVTSGEVTTVCVGDWIEYQGVISWSYLEGRGRLTH